MNAINQIIDLFLNHTYDPATLQLLNLENQLNVQQVVLPGVGLVYNLGSYFLKGSDVQYFTGLTVENLISDPLTILNKFEAVRIYPK